jgi:hypothetical protein
VAELLITPQQCGSGIPNFSGIVRCEQLFHSVIKEAVRRHAELSPVCHAAMLGAMRICSQTISWWGKPVE